jgi:hypothetical protein
MQMIKTTTMTEKMTPNCSASERQLHPEQGGMMPATGAIGPEGWSRFRKTWPKKGTGAICIEELSVYVAIGWRAPLEMCYLDQVDAIATRNGNIEGGVRVH